MLRYLCNRDTYPVHYIPRLTPCPNKHSSHAHRRVIPYTPEGHHARWPSGLEHLEYLTQSPGMHRCAFTATSLERLTYCCVFPTCSITLLRRISLLYIYQVYYLSVESDVFNFYLVMRITTPCNTTPLQQKAGPTALNLNFEVTGGISKN